MEKEKRGMIVGDESPFFEYTQIVLTLFFFFSFLK